jgi:hypothetical protein
LEQNERRFHRRIISFRKRLLEPTRSLAFRRGFSMLEKLALGEDFRDTPLASK